MCNRMEQKLDTVFMKMKRMISTYRIDNTLDE